MIAEYDCVPHQVSMPTDTDQHFDVFIHVYASTPMGDRRLGYLRYSTAALMRSVEDADGYGGLHRPLIASDDDADGYGGLHGPLIASDDDLS